MAARLMKTPMLHCLLLLMFMSASPALGQTKITYYSLLPNHRATDSGWLMIKVASRKPPNGWDLNWYIAVHTPQGFRLPVGRVKDSSESTGGNLLLQLPAGLYRVELSTRQSDPTEGALGSFDFEKGRWLPDPAEALSRGDTAVEVNAAQLKTVEIEYDAPEVSTETIGINKKRTVHLWRNLRLGINDGSMDQIPQEEPKAYPLTKEVSLLELNEVSLANAAKNGSQEATDVLRHLKQPNSEILISILTQPKELNAASAKLLATLRDRSAVDWLIQRLQSGKEPSAYLAAWALGEIGDLRALQPLLEALKAKSNSAMLRNYAAYALSQILRASRSAGDRNALSVLTQTAKERTCAKGTWGELVDFETPNLVFLDENYKAWPLIPLPSFCLSLNSIYALGQLRDDQVVETLANSEHPLAVMSLSSYRGERVVNALLGKLNSNQAIRWAAAESLGVLADEGALQPLLDLSKKEKDPVVLDAIKRAIQRIERKKGND